MINPSNSISFLRGPLAFLFLIESPLIRFSAIILAMITDVVDGYLARRYKFTSRFGAVLDPIMDKLFVLIILAILYFEGRVTLLETGLMLSRDIFGVAFLGYLFVTRRYKTFQFTPVRWSKVTTAIQFGFLILLALGFTIPSQYYFPFPLFAMLAFIELIQCSRQIVTK